MATRLSSLAPTNNTDANFRLWINEIHNSLIAFGWLQTSDTGQINFSTVTRPTATSTYQGYAIYKMNDALQSSCAVFIRIDFGTGSSTDGPGIKFRACIGSTDGAGTLTGNVTATNTLNGNAVGSATLNNCRNAGSTSSFRMQFWGSSVINIGWTVAIERDQTTAGADSSLGLNILTGTNGNNGFIMTSQFLALSGDAGLVDVLWYGFISGNTSQSGGGNIGVAPVRTQLGPFRNPMKTMLIYARGDFTVETTSTVTIYGTARTYMMLLPAFGLNRAINVWNNDCGISFLWE